MLAPNRILDGAIQKVAGLAKSFDAGNRYRVLFRQVVNDGSSVRGCVASQKVGNDGGSGFLAAYFDLQRVSPANIAIQESQADGSASRLVDQPGIYPRAATLPVRDHGSAGNVSNVLVATEDLVTGASDPFVGQLQGKDHAREGHP